jgi:hypothetical protein
MMIFRSSGAADTRVYVKAFAHRAYFIFTLSVKKGLAKIPFRELHWLFKRAAWGFQITVWSCLLYNIEEKEISQSGGRLEYLHCGPARRRRR